MNIIKVFRGSFDYGIIYIDEVSRINIDNGLIGIVCKSNNIKIGNKITFDGNNEFNRSEYNGIQTDDKIIDMNTIAAIIGVYDKFVIINKHYEVYTSEHIKMIKIKQKLEDTSYSEY